MSLVNDMLRDLDARRRDAPARGVGAAKLVPASDHPDEPASRRKPVWVWLIVPLLLLLLTVLVGYLMLAQDDGQLPAIVVSQPAVPASQPAAPASATDSGAALNESVGIELAQMSARMRELEEQNQALLRAQQSNTSSTQAPSLPTGALPTGATSGQSMWQAREWTPQTDTLATENVRAADTVAAIAPAASESPAAPVTPVTQERAQQAPVPRDAAGSTLRSPRDLSFSDTDRLRVQQALAQWSGGQQLAALQSLDTFTYDYPEAHHSREMLAKLLIQQGEPERAMQVADVGLAIAPRRNGYKKVKARLLLNLGQAAEAVTLLSAGLPAVQDDVEYHDLLATGLLSSAAYDQAAITYQALLETDERMGRWWYGLAASLDAQGRSAQAAQAYEQALRRENLSAALRQGSEQRMQAIRQAQL